MRRNHAKFLCHSREKITFYEEKLKINMGSFKYSNYIQRQYFSPFLIESWKTRKHCHSTLHEYEFYYFHYSLLLSVFFFLWLITLEKECTKYIP